MSNSHLVIARSGATTVAELCALGRPAIMVPLPHAKDNDQLENARRLEAAGGCWCMPQELLTAETLSVQVRKLFEDPSGLTSAAQKRSRLQIIVRLRIWRNLSRSWRINRFRPQAPRDRLGSCYLFEVG